MQENKAGTQGPSPPLHVRYARRTKAVKPIKRSVQKLFHKKAFVFTTALPPGG